PGHPAQRRNLPPCDGEAARELRGRHPALSALLLRGDDERGGAARRDGAAHDRGRLGGVRARDGPVRAGAGVSRLSGHGVWAGGTSVTYVLKRDPMTAAYVTYGYHHPPRGTQGGGTAAPAVAFKVRADGSEEELHPIAQVELQPGELLGHLLSGGGGYGDAR